MVIFYCLKHKSTSIPVNHILFCLFPNVLLPILLFFCTFKPFFPLIQILSFLEVKSWMPVLRAL